MLTKIILVGLGGAIGAVCRYLMSVFILSYLSHNSLAFGFVATLCVNIIACFLIGQCAYYIKDSQSLWYIFLAVGILGGFSTFSSFGLETFRLLENHLFVQAFSYIFLSNILGILFVFLGYNIQRFLRSFII
ncbi:fluoride efflux transporter CrcB [Helicobacter didelphidarum]|uniref:Fluoride-specific ion channel FluC n=1 Tax=Helicobacter didelphidarum TaxID=2040648 RepID=A0A3D8IQF1_9HELI|nr:fluoride efflux transporter CrcB [Helicobacter didelphidarum]RDU67499.1 fluoride efflux transporter CrcB [Helicobacter didelphidarum]